MRLRPWLIASIGLNLMLVAAWYIADLQEFHFTHVPTEPGVAIVERVRTNLLVRRISISWGDIASTNLSNYIANLVGIGCPAPTIRDIIVARVNQTYSIRRATEITTPDQQWWRSDPDPEVAGLATEQFRDLEKDRRDALDSLLGTNWETDADLLAWLLSNYGLTGPKLGDLPPGTKRAIYDIATRTQEELKGQNPMNTARIWQNERQELAALLPAEPLNEYLLRYSPTSRRIRDETRGLTLSPNQFEDLFAAMDPIVTQPDFYYQGSAPDLRKRQQSLQDEYDSILKKALGDQVFAARQLNEDPLYIAARDAAQQSGVPASALTPLYQINVATQAELNRIRTDATLSDEDKIDALANARAEAQKSIAQLLGPEAFQRWLQTQTKP